MMMTKDNLKQIFFIIIFVAVDTFFLFQYTERMGLSLLMALLFSIMAAAMLDILSYVTSFYGAGQWLNIPVIKLDKIIKDKRRAIIITILALFSVIVIQGFLIKIRFDQISEKRTELISRMESYNSTLDANNFLSERERNIYTLDRPNYDGNYMMDLISIFVPIATTILSFIIGMVNVKEYDYYKKEAEKKEGELREKHQELINMQKELDNILSQVDEKIKSIQLVGEIANLKELILSDISQKDNVSLGNFVKILEDNLQNGAQKIYAKNIETLISTLLVQAEKIKRELSSSADYPNDILNYDLKYDFENEINQLKILENIPN